MEMPSTNSESSGVVVESRRGRSGGPRVGRSASLPSLARQGSGISSGMHDSGMESEAGSEAPSMSRPASNRAASAAAGRRVVTATMAQHYYLEGDWGWVVVLCHLLVNMLVHGVQLSVGVLAGPLEEEFHQRTQALGEYSCVWSCSGAPSMCFMY